ncbi:MAG: PQQ-dependent sugar dehydrogenase [Steroidobacteraceae bacterium]
MTLLRPGLCLFALLSSSLAVAQRAVPVNKNGTPTSPPGLSQPLPQGPFAYRTGEGQDIRVSVIGRLAWPYGLAFLPNGDLLVSQRISELRVMPKGSTELRVVTGGPKSIVPTQAGVHGYMSIAVHPHFAQNQWIYLVYAKPLANDKLTTAVARARYVDGKLLDTTDIWVGENITGGPAAVAMTPDAKLYIATSGGFGTAAQDPMLLAGKVLRLNDDGSVPDDNPFVGKQGFRAEIYTLGHRTALGLGVHPVSGQVFMSEMGPNGGDEINQLKPGSNYGWPIVSLGRAYPGPWHAQANEPTHHGFELPMVYWTPSISVSGLSFYNGDALPKWKGDLFVGGVRYGEISGTGRVDRVVLNEKYEEMRRETLLADLHQRVRDVKAGPDGLIYVATDEEDGALLRIEPATPPVKPPTKP